MQRTLLSLFLFFLFLSHSQASPPLLSPPSDDLSLASCFSPPIRDWHIYVEKIKKRRACLTRNEIIGGALCGTIGGAGFFLGLLYPVFSKSDFTPLAVGAMVGGGLVLVGGLVLWLGPFCPPEPPPVTLYAAYEVDSLPRGASISRQLRFETNGKETLHDQHSISLGNAPIDVQVVTCGHGGNLSACYDKTGVYLAGKLPKHQDDKRLIELEWYRTREEALQHRKRVELQLPALAAQTTSFQKLIENLERNQAKNIALIPYTPLPSGFSQFFIDYRQGYFSVIDRSPGALRTLFQEQRLGISGAIDSVASSVAIGKLLGVEAMLHINAGSNPSEFHVKAVIVQSGRIVFDSTISLEEMKSFESDPMFQRPSRRPLSKTSPSLNAGAGGRLQGTVLLLVNEQSIEGTPIVWHDQLETLGSNISVVEQELIAQLSGKGLAFVDVSVLRSTLKIHSGLKVVDLKVSQARKLGLEVKADYVLIGQAIARGSKAHRVRGMYSTQASLSVRMIRIQDGVIVASAAVVGSGMHAEWVAAGTQALTQAARHAAQKIAETLQRQETLPSVGKLELRSPKAPETQDKPPAQENQDTPSPKSPTEEKEPPSKGSSVRLVVDGVATYRQAQRIQSFLSKQKGKPTVRLVRFASKQLILSIQGLSTSACADLLSSAKTPVKIEVTGLQDNEIKATVVSR